MGGGGRHPERENGSVSRSRRRVGEQMADTVHYSRSALPEHALRQAASVDVAEQLGFAGFLDAHAAQERPEPVEEEPSPDEAARKRLMQMMQKYDGAPPRQYQPPPTSGLSLAELSIEPNTLDEQVLQPVLQSLDADLGVVRADAPSGCAEAPSRSTAIAAELPRQPLPLSPLPPAAARFAASQSAAQRQALKDLMQLASPQLLQTLASSDLARRCLDPMLDAEDAATLETAATLGSIRRQDAAPEPSVSAAPERTWSSGSGSAQAQPTYGAQVRVQLRFGTCGAQVRLRFGAGSASSSAPLPQIEPAPPNQQPDATTRAVTVTPATLALSGRPVSSGRESVTVERQVGPAQQRPRRGRQKVKGAAR